jgi:ketosteroid isomerase-like protein
MTNAKYSAFVALDPFFDVVMQGLAGVVDGDHYFEAVADDAVFEYRYVFPNFPTKIVGRNALMALYSGYGDGTILHSGDSLIVHRSQEPGVLILEYEVHGKKIRTGKAYDNRFISVVTIKDRKIVHWRDYMDSLAAFTAETGAAV